ncbi:GNAT family N-acetyltransferase [Ureibacillus sinduriensis]|uniref:N-acetyltransferase domain-containing protein n=1 Tax=Ureibacillus sinduriensis BLB-1 = JCM 15800 TaxID=1384057 RepID=A0A0A3I324_9BACL|nr:N-acetyltransferase [Ureibacillus sinduriensis]KGR77073.1 hypothetical protein CD33_03965 [Ureibacillus sinduriensis BLB-1 = JCM 15800]
MANFLYEVNNQKSSHIGYCGDKVEEIYATLKKDFVQENGRIAFYIAKNIEGKIDAAIGLDIDGKSAEVWGPFNKTSSHVLQQKIWGRLLEEYPTIRSFNFFLNSDNHIQQEFMNILQATKTGEHLILELQKENFEGVLEFKSTKYCDTDYQAFEYLHGAEFPDTYYDAKTIVARLNDEYCFLRVLKSTTGEILGYAHYEVDMELGEAFLHYIAISPSAKNQGYGTMLLNEVITELFTFLTIKEIKLCVERKNDQANHIYFKVGFTEKDILFNYRLKRG